MPEAETNVNQPEETPLESWKAIAAYLQRNAVTVRRWEKEEGLPVHRHSHKSRSSVYAYPSEIDAWRASRKVVPEPIPARPLWKIPAFALTMVLCLIMVGNGVRPMAAQQSRAIAKRLICSDCGGKYEPDLSHDGRWMGLQRLGRRRYWGPGHVLEVDSSGCFAKPAESKRSGRSLPKRHPSRGPISSRSCISGLNLNTSCNCG